MDPSKGKESRKVNFRAQKAQKADRPEKSQGPVVYAKPFPKLYPQAPQ
jgi:hypothetical protein